MAVNRKVIMIAYCDITSMDTVDRNYIFKRKHCKKKIQNKTLNLAMGYLLFTVASAVGKMWC